MAKSLADQLLKAGLVDKKKVKQVQQAKRKQAKKAHKTNAELDNNEARLERERQAKAEHDRQLNLQAKALADQKAQQAQIADLINQHKITIGGDLRFNFIDRRVNKIKHFFISQELQHQLAKGQLAICATASQYAVVPIAIAAKIAERDASALIFQTENTVEDDADPYKDFQIPDDLMW